ncbi:hypothetical protein [Psychromonas sp. KJ10-2]|uniref:hypothetical protein n=1 Tax=Psychromonas sp. KJ10-2 TaxID=3391822 RepID=UPI0039B5BD29
MVQKVMASGIKYNRAVDACNELDISPATLQSRLNSKTKKWRDWYRIKDKEEEKRRKRKRPI